MANAKMATDIPAAITMPDSVETRLGTLRFTDGFPDDATVQKVYDNLDFQRGVQAFLTAMPAASLSAIRRGIRSFGPDNQTVIIFESLMDSRVAVSHREHREHLCDAWLNLKDGPVVVESPPNTLGLVDDFWFRYVTDLGNAGPDKGKGGKFLFLPPGYNGSRRRAITSFRSRTFGNMVRHARLSRERRSQAGCRQHQAASTHLPVVAGGSTAGDELRQRVWPRVQHHPCDGFLVLRGSQRGDPGGARATRPILRRSDCWRSIGIAKGTPFAPDARMKQILTEAAAVGQATARTLAYRSRLPEAHLYPNSAWEIAVRRRQLRIPARRRPPAGCAHRSSSSTPPASRRRCR